MTDSVLDVTADALEQAGAHPHRLVVRQHGQVVGRRRAGGQCSPQPPILAKKQRQNKQHSPSARPHNRAV
ncbi:hypothetical protein LRP56_11815, partial [Cutibacterium acnes]|nr:hypothetical protein [Cutibacterium acnes]